MDKYKKLSKIELSKYPIKDYPDHTIKALYRVLYDERIKQIKETKHQIEENWDETKDSSYC